MGLNGGADFYGRDPKELQAKFKKSLHEMQAISPQTQW